MKKITHDDIFAANREESPFIIHPGDEDVLAMISVADVKSLIQSINFLNEKVDFLHKDNAQLRERIEGVERAVNSLAEYHN